MRGNTGHRAGPAPDPDALRRDRDRTEWTVLLAAGREGPTPAWPLIDPTDRELELWEREWRRPQAVVWEHNRQEDEVALHVRSLVVAEQPNASVGSRRWSANSRRRSASRSRACCATAGALNPRRVPLRPPRRDGPGQRWRAQGAAR